MIAQAPVTKYYVTHPLQKMAAPVRQVPLTCSGHTRPVVHLKYSEVTPKGFFFISACKGDWVHVCTHSTDLVILVVFIWPQWNLSIAGTNVTQVADLY